VRWSLNCMINAEEMGLSSDNILEFVNHPGTSSGQKRNSAVQYLLGNKGNIGLQLGLSNQWCANIISHVGNYAESYERNLGEQTALGLARGVNHLWTDGGLLYAPPIR